MDDNVVNSRAAASASGPVVVVEGVEVASFQAVVARLVVDYPSADLLRVETIVLREWEAFSAGRPLVVPTAVEEGAREILGQAHG